MKKVAIALSGASLLAACTTAPSMPIGSAQAGTMAMMGKRMEMTQPVMTMVMDRTLDAAAR
jgi:hypothetical protein